MGLDQRLRELRETKGWTQAEVGLKLGLADATINRYERGQRTPDIKILWHFAELYDVSFDYLLDRTDNPAICRDPQKGGAQNEQRQGQSAHPRETLLQRLEGSAAIAVYRDLSAGPESPLLTELGDHESLALVLLYKKVTALISRVSVEEQAGQATTGHANRIGVDDVLALVARKDPELAAQICAELNRAPNPLAGQENGRGRVAETPKVPVTAELIRVKR